MEFDRGLKSLLGRFRERLHDNLLDPRRQIGSSDADLVVCVSERQQLRGQHLVNQSDGQADHI